MVHTVEIGHRLSRDKTIDFARSQSVFDEEQLDQLLDGHVDEIEAAEYQLPGFNKFRLYRRGSEQYYFLCIVINPQVLLTNRPTIDLFSCSQEAVQALETPFQAGMEIVSDVTFEPLLSWSVVRIDYALNLHTHHVPVYVALAKRAQLPRGYVYKEDKPGSFYVGCNSVTLNFYDKQDQMQKQPNWGQHYNRLCQDAANIYRIEVQCKGSKRFDIMNDYRLPNINVAGFLNEQIAQDTIQGQYCATVGYGDYYSLPAVWWRIQETSWRRPKKERVYNWLRLIAEAGSYPASIPLFLDGAYLDGEPDIWVQGSRRTLIDYEQSCQRERINLITIPSELSLNMDFLPNPMRQVV